MMQNPDFRGSVLMALAMAGFALEDMFIKLAAITLPAGQVLLILAIGGTLIFGATAQFQGIRLWSPLARNPGVILRTLAEVVGSIGLITAIALTPLSSASAIMQATPLFITLCAALFMGEQVGWRRWSAISFGFVGILIILQPGSGRFAPAALLPLASALMFALYSILTRLATRTEASFVSLFWSGILGTILITAIGIWYWEPMTGPDWGWMAAYGSLAVLGNWLLIRCYEVAEASAVQPFAYLQLVFVSAIGTLFFDEVLRSNVVIGAALVVMAGLATIWHSRIGRASV